MTMSYERAMLQWADYKGKHPLATLWEPFTYREQIDQLKRQLRRRCKHD